MLRSTLTTTTTLGLALGLSFVAACPTPTTDDGSDGGREGEGEGEGEGENPGDGNCPVVAGGNSVCDVQDSASANAVLTGAQVTLPGVVATSQAFGSSFTAGVPSRFNLFIGDNPNKTRGGVFVSWPATAGLPTDIVAGDVLTIVGQVSEFTLASDIGPGTETRIDATAITKAGTNTPLVPLDVTEAQLEGATAEDYEGVLVRLQGGEAAATDQFGFTLAGGAKIANAIFNYPALIGETFTSITGPVRFDIFQASGFELMPRAGTDVVSAARPTKTITQLNDGTVTRCPGGESSAPCAVAVAGIVTSPAFFINNNDTARKQLFGFYVADPANVEAGRFGPNSGVLVTINPFTTITSEQVALDGYTFDQQTTFPFDFLAGAAPQPGDTVEIFGENSDRFGLRNVRGVKALKKTGTATLPLPALFGTGGRSTTELKGGRPAFADGDFSAAFTPALEGVAAATTVEQWEAVLVELNGVSTTTACYAQAFDPDPRAGPAVANNSFARDFGNFLVTGDVEIGTAFRLPQSFGGFFADTVPDAQKVCTNLSNKCEDSRALGQNFTKIVGIVDFSFDVHRVSPRTADDIVGVSFAADNTPANACPAN